MARAAAHKPSTAPSGTESLFDAPPSYEAALAELDALVARMEGGQLPLDQLLGSYRRGAELLAFCRTRLAAVETQVKQLNASGALEPWVDPA